MSAKASKKSNEASRKKKLRDEAEAEEARKPKKLKTSKNEKHVAFDEDGGAVKEIGGKSNNKEEAPQGSGKVENEQQEKEQIDWPQEDLQQLVTRMEMLVPDKDNMAFCTRVEKLNWEKIAFNDYTAEECKKTWILIQKRIRRFRILTEVLKDAREWINKPWTNFYKAGKTKNHPEMPRRPLSTYMLFYLQKKDEIIAKNPGMEMTDVSKKLSELYKTLSAEERAKYSKLALEKRKEYEEKLQEFYSNHPEFLQLQEKPKAAPDAGPLKPLTPFMLFCKEQMKKGQVENEGEAKEQWKTLWNNMSDKKKVVWINWAAEEEAKYKDTLKNYVSQHPNYVPPQVKPVLTKKEKVLQERVAGKPLKPPNSAYSLFSRVMLQSEDIKNIDAKNRLNYVSRQWKLCNDEVKQQYKERADHLMEQYKLDFASYLESLPEEKRVEELKNNMPKRKTKDANDNAKKNPQEVKNDFLFKGEPNPPPLTAIALFKNTYKGKRSVKDAWKALSEKDRKKFADKVEIMKTKYIAEFEVFLKTLSKEEIKAYKKHRKEAEQRNVAVAKPTAASDSDSDSSET